MKNNILNKIEPFTLYVLDNNIHIFKIKSFCVVESKTTMSKAKWITGIKYTFKEK